MQNTFFFFILLPCYPQQMLVDKCIERRIYSGTHGKFYFCDPLLQWLHFSCSPWDKETSGLNAKTNEWLKEGMNESVNFCIFPKRLNYCLNLLGNCFLSACGSVCVSACVCLLFNFLCFCIWLVYLSVCWLAW